MYGIRWAHHAIGLPSPTDNPMVKLAYEGCLRSCKGTRQKKEALPTEVLKELIDLLRTEGPNLGNQRFLLVCVIGFCGFFRIEELLHVQLKHLKIENDYLRIFLENQKPTKTERAKKCTFLGQAQHTARLLSLKIF